MVRIALGKLVVLLLLGLGSRCAWADLAVAEIPEDMPSGVPYVQVGGFLFRGLGAQELPTRTGNDSVIWGAKNGTEMVPPNALYPPERTPSGSVSVYPNLGPSSTMATILGFRNTFGGFAPGQVLDDFSLYVTINETTPGLDIYIDKLDVTIISHLNPDPINDWANPNYILARYNIEGPASPPVPGITPDPFPPPYRVRLLNDSQEGNSVADYEIRFNGGLHLANYAPEEYIRLDLGMSELNAGNETIWARTSSAVLGTFDYGDAPDSYGTLQASNGPYHAVGSNEWMGELWDGEEDGQPSPLADGDDLNGVDDEDGFTVADGEVSIMISVADSQSARYQKDPLHPEMDQFKNLYLDAWLDWGQDGSFLEPEDHIVAAYVEDPSTWGAGVNSKIVTVAVPDFVPTMQGNYFRWRLSYGAPSPGPQGYSPYGEVSDFFVTPEPSSLAILGGALLALFRSRRRRRTA